MDLGVDVPAVRALHWCGAFAADTERREADRTVHGIVNMAAHIAKRARAVVEAFAPVAGVVVAADVFFGATPHQAFQSSPAGTLSLRSGRWAVSPHFCCSRYALGDFANRPLMHSATASR